MNSTKSLKSNNHNPKAIHNDGLFAYVSERGNRADWFLSDISQQFETILNTISRNPG